MQEDYEYSMDFEALKVEMQQCKETLMEKIGVIGSLDMQMSRMIDSFPSEFYSSKNIELDNLEGIEGIIRKIKDSR